MVRMTIEYEGDLHCRATHLSSGKVISTDAPLDIGGKGEGFSPTDLLGCSLASCIATTLALYAQKKEWDLRGMWIDVEKTMTDQPSRQIKSFRVVVQIPGIFTEEERLKLERVARNCPVHKSLNPDVEVNLIFDWTSKMNIK